MINQDSNMVEIKNVAFTVDGKGSIKCLQRQLHLGKKVFASRRRKHYFGDSSVFLHWRIKSLVIYKKMYVSQCKDNFDVIIVFRFIALTSYIS